MYRFETVFEFSIPRVKFGWNAIEEISYEARRFDCRRILIVTDKGLMDTGIPDSVKAILERDGGVEVSIYSGVSPEPPRDDFERCINYAREIDADLLVAVGGGSSIDIAKTAGIVLRWGGSLIDYLAPPTGLGKEIPGRGKPVIAVPSTAGTGSEVSPASVISIPEEKIKVGISSIHQKPILAIVDPMLTVSMPPNVTASTGVDALSHAVEAYITRRFDAKPAFKPGERPVYGGGNPLTDIFASTAVKLISEFLPRAYNNPLDFEARWHMSLGSLLAGIAFTNAGLGLAHAIALAVGGRLHHAHGEVIAAVLPSVLEFNSSSKPKALKEIAELMDIPVRSLSSREASTKAISAIRELIAELKLPGSLRNLGVGEGDVPAIVEDTLKIKRLLEGNPRRVTREDIEEIMLRNLNP
ncbi:MAG: hydroxyacid-oxoacid transhydrogenase [Candidatus Bathyarchaeia archaeon]